MSEEIYLLDTDRSNIRWEGTSITGRETGSLLLTKGGVKIVDKVDVEGYFEIDMHSLTSDLENETLRKQLLTHLKSEDFFDVANYPKAVMVVKDIVPEEGDTHIIVGDLTIKGQTHEISFSADMEEDEKEMYVEADISLDRTEWGITFRSGKLFSDLGDKLINDAIGIQLQLIFQKRI